MGTYKAKHEGVRWRIIYGNAQGVEGFALTELQRMAQDFLPYVVTVIEARQEAGCEGWHTILLGTVSNNAGIADLAKQGLISIPDRPQGFSVSCLPSSSCKNGRIVVIAGNDAAGVLYGVEDFNARVLAARVMPDNPARKRHSLDEMDCFTFEGYPTVANRGIWTWGYVLYDCRRFIDNMARLKMNMLIVWNDCPPLNIKDIINYAHTRGVKIILGFHWGWGLENIDITSPEDRRTLREEVLANYNANYRHLGMDGIYFQTLTEHNDLFINGCSVAAAVCDLVNEISAELFREEPDLYIQFGLHAMSIMDNYPDLKGLDKRVVIVWEDAGIIPYSYNPVADEAETGMDRPAYLDNVQATLEYSRKIASFRAEKEFAMVAKGFICLRWLEEFEHHGPFIMGERSSEFIRHRLEERQPRWDRVNELWIKNFPIAASFYREILQASPAGMTVVGLVEDGMFEEAIQISTALFAETLWNPYQSDVELLQRAMSPYYRRHF
ncbi:MAG: hypothetical protein PHT33_06610 [bacterium]|nr:hypothetical protein [bacterium]